MNRRNVLTAIGLGAAIVPLAAAAKPAGESSLRVSNEKGDPGERLYAQLCGDRKGVKVYLDGKEQRDAVMADPGLGVIKRAVTSPKGNIAINHATGEILYEEVHGVVRWDVFDL